MATQEVAPAAPGVDSAPILRTVPLWHERRSDLEAPAVPGPVPSGRNIRLPV
jgi:hypothetical protein